MRVSVAPARIRSVANRDRLTGLDSSFLHLERDSAHMHVAGCAIFEGPAPDHDELCRGDRLASAPRAPLPAAARIRAARAGSARVGRRPAFQRRIPRAPHGAAPPGRRRRAQAARRPRVLPGARSDAAAVGAVARRRARGRSASRCCRRPTTRSSTASPASTSRPCCSTPRPIRRRSRRPSTTGSRSRCRPGRSCWPTRCSSVPPSPRRSCVAFARCSGPAAGRRPGRDRIGRTRRDGVGGAERRTAEPVQRPDRTAPAVRLGERRPAAVQGDQERARRDGQRRRPGGRRGRARELHAHSTDTRPRTSC